MSCIICLISEYQSLSQCYVLYIHRRNIPSMLVLQFGFNRET